VPFQRSRYWARWTLRRALDELRDGDYFGSTVNRAARLMSVGHGGQVLCSQATAALIDAEVALVDLGQNRFRDLGPACPRRVRFVDRDLGLWRARCRKMKMTTGTGGNRYGHG
jgi:class 3 adenylate cyclase